MSEPFDTSIERADDETPSRLGAGVMAAVVVFAALAAFWGWIFVYQLQNRGEDDMPDRLDDLAWTAEADQICAASNARIAELPPAPTADDATERAQVIDAATDELDDMLDRIESVAPRGPTEDAELTASWLADYRIFLQDRRDYADTLRSDPDARFLVTEKYGGHITEPIDRFARVNEMEACMTSGDV